MTKAQPVDTLISFVKSNLEEFPDVRVDTLEKGLLRNIGKKLENMQGVKARIVNNPRTGDIFRHRTTGLEYQVQHVHRNAVGHPLKVKYQAVQDWDGEGHHKCQTLNHSEYKNMLGFTHEPVRAGSLGKSVEKAVKNPGSRGGKGYYASDGWHYGEPPKGKRGVVTGTLDSKGGFKDDVMERQHAARRKAAIVQAAQKQRDMGGIPHHVIEHGFPAGDAKNPASGARSFTVVQAVDTFDEVRGNQQAGQVTHGVYTSRGRKLSGSEVNALTSRQDAEIGSMKLRAKDLANKDGFAYGVMSITPKGGRTTYNTFPFKHRQKIIDDTAQKYPQYSLRSVARVDPDMLPAVPVAPVPSVKNKRKKNNSVKYKMSDYEYENDPRTLAKLKSEDATEASAPVEEKQVDTLTARFVSQGPLVGDIFESIPAPGFSYKTVGNILEVQPNGMALVEHAPWGEPKRREYMHKGELVRSITVGKIRLVKSGEVPEEVAYEGPVCRKCGAPESTQLPNSGYCDSCLTPTPPRWW